MRVRGRGRARDVADARMDELVHLRGVGGGTRDDAVDAVAEASGGVPGDERIAARRTDRRGSARRQRGHRVARAGAVEGGGARERRAESESRDDDRESAGEGRGRASRRDRAERSAAAPRREFFAGGHEGPEDPCDATSGWVQRAVVECPNLGMRQPRP